MLLRALAIALFVYALLLGLVEGPAEIACLAVLMITFATGEFPFSGSLVGHSPPFPPGRGPEPVRNLRLGAAEIGLLVYLLAGVVGLAGDHPRGSSEDTFRPLLALSFLVGRVSMGAHGGGDKTIDRMAWAFGAAIVANAIYGYVRATFVSFPLDALFLKDWRSSQQWVPDHIGGYRSVAGLYYNRLKLAHVGIVGMGLLGLVALRKEARRWTRTLALTGLGVLGIALLLTFARMAFAALLVSAILTALVMVRRIRWRIAALVAGLAAALAGAAIASSEMLRERLDTFSADLALRGRILAVGLDIARAHPILGVGHGMYRVTAQGANVHGDLTREWLIDAHNLFLHVLAETGIVGLLGFLTLVSVSLYKLARRIRAGAGSGGGSARATLDALAFFGVVAILVLGLVHFPLHHAPVALVFWTLMGVAGLP